MRRAVGWGIAVMVVAALELALMARGPVSDRLILVCIGAALVGAAFLSARRAVLAARRAVAATSAGGGSGFLGETDYQSARWIYYAGILTMPMLALRLRGLTLSDVIFLACLLLATGQMLLDRESRLPALPRLFAPAVAIFATGALFATAIHSHDMAGSLAITARVLYLLVAWFLLGAVVLRTPRQVRTAIVWWVVGAATCAAFAAGQKYLGLPGVARDGRFSGLTEHVNDLGGMCAVAIVPALMLAYVERRVVYLVPVAALFEGIALSGSVGGAVAATAALALCTVSKELGRAVLVLAVVGGGALGYLTYTGNGAATPVGRFSTVTDQYARNGQGTLYTRIDVDKHAWAGIRRDPLVGTGLDGESSQIYSPPDGRTIPVHNVLLARWYESGLLGLIGIGVLFWALFAAGWRNALALRDEDQLMAISLLAGTTAFVVLGLVEPLLYQRYALAPAALVVALTAVLQRRAVGLGAGDRSTAVAGLTEGPHPRTALGS